MTSPFAHDGPSDASFVVELSAFSSAAEQLDLLDPGRREKLERLARTTDRLRDRFGFSKVQFGASLTSRDHRDE